MVWAVAVVFAVATGVLATHAAGLFIWLPVVSGDAMILWALIRNPRNGLRVTDACLILSPWQKPRRLPLADIEAVKYHQWSDSTDMHAWLRSGETVRVPPMDIPPVDALRAVLAARSIPVIET